MVFQKEFFYARNTLGGMSLTAQGRALIEQTTFSIILVIHAWSFEPLHCRVVVTHQPIRRRRSPVKYYKNQILSLTLKKIINFTQNN